jgi:GNAT superfamily N-acetyltransferase
LTRRKLRGFASGVPPRRATPADARAIAEVHVASWQVAYRGFFPDAVLDNLSVADRQALWLPRLQASAFAIWVTEEAGRLTGFVSACPSRDADAPPPAFSEVAALYVHPDAWATGCGRALCDAVFAEMRHTPAQTVLVWVLTGNVRARRFYESLGFIPDDARKNVTLFNVTLPEVRYRLSLR